MARRRRAIEFAAMRQFAENGYDATTVAQIAEEAEVSARTVALYFPSKLDMALSYSAAASARLRDACAERAPHTSIADALRSWIAAEFHTYADLIALHAKMLATNPTLRGAETPQITEHRLAVTAALAAELDRLPTDPFVILAAGAMIGLLTALMDLGSSDIDLDTVLDTTKELLEAIITRTSSGAA